VKDPSSGGIDPVREFCAVLFGVGNMIVVVVVAIAVHDGKT